MRILLDECGFTWDHAFDIVRRTFAYTNHTVMSEALEKWNVDIFKTVSYTHLWDTAGGYRLSSQVPSSKDDNAPCGASTKSCAAVLFWHQKSTQKSAAVSHAADPRASRGAPAGAAVFPGIFVAPS